MNFQLPVSHTTDDLKFEWDPDVPLVVDEYIELPQLALIKNFTADCTQVNLMKILSNLRNL
jgi:histamine-gated chloride channel